jgi:uncharacterized membrane protein
MKFSSILFKVISWRIISIISMLITMYVLTGNIAKSTGLTVIVQIVQMIVHAVFESAWERKFRGVDA